MRRTFGWILAASLGLAGCSASAGVAVEPRVGILVSDDADDRGSDRVWVCHNGRWQEVGAPAAGGHSGHGDRVSDVPREPRSRC